MAAVSLGAIVVACLPDLADFPSESSDEAGPPFVGCGDGVIATLEDGGDAGESCDPDKRDAQVPGCTSCRLACEGTLDPTSGHCYFVLGSDPAYDEATQRCQGKGAHLVTLASVAEAALVDDLVADGGGATSYWIGLSRIPSFGDAYGPSRVEEPGFPYPPAGGKAAGPCQGCFGLGADGGVFPLEDAAASDPPCIASRGGSWLRVERSNAGSRTIVCEREPAGMRLQEFCSAGWCFTLAATAGKKSYVVALEANDAAPDRAAETCAALGGSLVILDSAEEREQLAHELLARVDAPAGPQEVWIGLATDAGVWAWEDGVPATADAGRPLPWGHAQPVAGSAARAFMWLRPSAYDTQLAYADDNAGATRTYVCQRAPQLE